MLFIIIFIATTIWWIYNFSSTTGVLWCLICTKSVFGHGSARGPTGGAYDVPPADPDLVVGWGGGRPLLIPLSIDAFGLSTWAPSPLRFLPPLKQIPG